MRALKIYEKDHGEDHPDVAMVLRNIGFLSIRKVTFPNFPKRQPTTYAQGNFDEAHSSCERALDIYKKVHGEDHTTIATVLNILGILSLMKVSFRVS